MRAGTTQQLNLFFRTNVLKIFFVDVKIGIKIDKTTVEPQISKYYK